MAENTAIEWTDVTDNIIVVKGGGWWCHKISAGCQHCYAAALNQNDFFGGNHLQYGGTPPKLILREDILERWKRQTKPRKHFVASMTDVFGEWVPREWIFCFLDAMAAASLQTFQILSKRTHIMRREVSAWLEARELDRVPSNMWLGASVEDQEQADLRIPELVQIPGTLFLSIEPLLGPVSIHGLGWLPPADGSCQRDGSPAIAQVSRTTTTQRGSNSVSWVIVGGESGRNARPMHPSWLRWLRDQCTAAGVAFFFKQWGQWRPNDQGDYVPSRATHIWPDGEASFLVGKHAAGRELDGVTWGQFPDSVKA
jgi:protein gp37